MNMISRNQIIEKIKEKLEPLDYIYALWLEGADASNIVDEYSDIDLWVDFEDERENEAIEVVEASLAEMSNLDYKYVMKHEHPKLRQRIYHLEGSSDYLMIDFCWQLHSRPKIKFIRDNYIESAKVIFDKANIIEFEDNNPARYEENNLQRLINCKYRYSQHVRVNKYVLRGQYLEAYAFYNRYVLEPLIDLLRILYTPANADLYLIHISHHLSKSDLARLEYFTQISSLKDITEKILPAQEWFVELTKKLESPSSNIGYEIADTK